MGVILNNSNASYLFIGKEIFRFPFERIKRQPVTKSISHASDKNIYHLHPKKDSVFRNNQDLNLWPSIGFSQKLNFPQHFSFQDFSWTSSGRVRTTLEVFRRSSPRHRLSASATLSPDPRRPFRRKLLRPGAKIFGRKFVSPNVAFQRLAALREDQMRSAVRETSRRPGGGPVLVA